MGSPALKTHSPLLYSTLPPFTIEDFAPGIIFFLLHHQFLSFYQTIPIHTHTLITPVFPSPHDSDYQPILPLLFTVKFLKSCLLLPCHYSLFNHSTLGSVPTMSLNQRQLLTLKAPGLHPQLFLSSGCTPPQVLSAGRMALNPSLDLLLPRGHPDRSLAPELWAPATSLLACLSYVRTEHVKTKLLSLNLCPLSSPITTNEPPPTQLLAKRSKRHLLSCHFPCRRSSSKFSHFRIQMNSLSCLFLFSSTAVVLVLPSSSPT